MFFLLPECKENNDYNKKTEPPEGCINLSALETEHNYYLPFALENDNSNINSAILNNKAIDFSFGDFIEFTETGFYELILKYKDTKQPNDTFLFTTKTEERELSEWGIRAWVPATYSFVKLKSETVEPYYPRRYTDLIKVPFIFYIKEAGSVKEIFCHGKCNATADTFNIKQGVGSVNIAASAISDKAGFTIGGRQLSLSLTKISQPDIELSGTITTAREIPANSLVRISGNLNISSSGSLTVREGAVIVIEEAADINVSGPIVFSGTAVDPVFVTCSDMDKYWGGFITRVPGGTIDAKYAIFCQSGYHDTEEYAWGHAGRQALFYTENSTLKLDHCYITDHIGQIFYPVNATLIFDNILIQRAKTGGQINNSELTLRNSVLTDFPVESDEFIDNDNDALYLDASDATIDNTTFMFAKDDGLDSGAGEGGEVIVTNCRFESCFHEGAALSSIDPAIKHQTFSGCIFTNCGQGLELGYSSTNHTVVADNCLFLYNGVGIRYGDNYDWSEVHGTMVIKNSFSLYNDRDVWNMVCMSWKPKLENMSFINTRVSKYCPQYPELILYSE